MKPANMTPAQRVTLLSTRLGRTPQQIEDLLTVGRQIILRWGRQRYYSELNSELAYRTGQPQFDFSEGGDRQIGGLLGEISRLEMPYITALTHQRALLTVLVWKKQPTRIGDQLGGGFYDLAEEFGLLTGGHKATLPAKDASMVAQHRTIMNYITILQQNGWI
jgi:hypothetical protein